MVLKLERKVTLKRWLICTVLYVVTSLKTTIFIVIAIGASNISLPNEFCLSFVSKSLQVCCHKNGSQSLMSQFPA